MKNKSAENGNNSDIKHLGKLIEKIDIAMLTTIDNDGTLRSRPMATQQIEFDGDLWFFTGADSAKVDEARKNRQVNVSYADAKAQRYVWFLPVKTQLVRDAQMMKELWNPLFKAWFPGGLDDPNLALLRIHVDKAEYWRSTKWYGRTVGWLCQGPGDRPRISGRRKRKINLAGKQKA